MAKVKLTKRFVETAGPGEYWDTDLSGFVLLITPRGHRSFQVRYRLPHRKGTHTYGSYPALSVEQAREVARGKLFGISQGSDPSAEKLAARRAWTVKQLSEHFIVEHLPQLRAASQVTYKHYLKAYILPAVGRQLVAEVTRADILRMFRDTQKMARKVVDGKVTRPGTTTANRVLAVASSLFSEAIAQGLRTDNPCKLVKRHPENKRERYLDATETARLLAVCDKSPHLNGANFIRLLTLTGARRGETMQAKWDEFDLDAGIWLKPSHHTKQKRSHRLPLSPAAVAALRDIRAASASPWLFPSEDPDKPVTDLKKSVAVIFKEAGLGKDVTLHTLRHSFAARVVSAGHGLHAAGTLLGHTQAATTHRYAHLEQDAQLRALRDVDSAIASAQARLKSSTNT
jgi:integrase